MNKGLVEDPKVIVSYAYENYEQGAFVATACIPLSVYLAVTVANYRFYFSDPIGHRSQHEPCPREFEVSYFYVEDENECAFYGDCKASWIKQYSELLETSKNAANEYVKSHGPYLPSSEFDFQRALDELSQSVPKKKAKKDGK